jgi:hypothetical protein
MSTSEAQIRANQANSARSTGPRTSAGKSRSRENSLKHGLTGDGIVMPAEDAAEVDRLYRSFEADLNPSGEVGRTLVRRMALMAVRMDRSADQERAHLAEHIAEALADFDEEWPAVEGVADPERQRMRTLVARQAMFDPSKKATLARKYEAAAERCFFRSLKELRLVEKQAKTAGNVPASPGLGSFLPAESKRPTVAAPAVEPARKVAQTPSKAVAPAPIARSMPVRAFPDGFGTSSTGHFDVPFSIGRAR